MSCSHPRIEPTDLVGTYLSTLFKTEIYKVKCLDCPNVYLKQKRKLGRLTGLLYSSQLIEISQFSCQHQHWNLIDNTSSVDKEETTGGQLVNLLFMGLFSELQYHSFYRAEAKCLFCDCQFYVRAEYQTIWKEQKQVNQLTTEWIPMIDNQQQFIKVKYTI